MDNEINSGDPETAEVRADWGPVGKDEIVVFVREGWETLGQAFLLQWTSNG